MNPLRLRNECSHLVFHASRLLFLFLFRLSLNSLKFMNDAFSSFKFTIRPGPFLQNSCPQRLKWTHACVSGLHRGAHSGRVGRAAADFLGAQHWCRAAAAEFDLSAPSAAKPLRPSRRSRASLLPRSVLCTAGRVRAWRGVIAA